MAIKYTSGDIADLQSRYDEKTLETARDWYAKASQTPVREKQQITIRLDAEIVDAFKATGKGWQSRMNSVLRFALGIGH
jgi:uncharacterized protein (DUF4415 family)